MASVQLVKDGDCSDNPRAEFANTEFLPRIPSDSLEPPDKFKETDIEPRVGHEYQAEVPPLVGKLNYFSHPEKSIDAENQSHPLQNLLTGLPLPLTWISIMKQAMLRSLNRPKSISDFTYTETNAFKRETTFVGIEPSSDSGNLVKESKELLSSDNGEEPGYALVPGLCNEDWSKAERDSFLLGLYIFEKNFVEVRRFVGTKEMGSILSFYYGIFHGSQEYRRWSESRKAKSKKCVYGQKLFSEARQHELLSRIRPSVSEECQNALLEVSKTFRDEKTSLSDYVYSLKSMVGIEILVKAIGIGTGKNDLTGMALESSRSAQAVPTRPEIPTGKACSSLTTSEIIKFLSGGYRLSKARSNDLFWEAVWPRLLARGWHSEQPSDQSYIANSNHCLVFLTPGVKKFSRRKLVKGDHYFDSVSDVLSKVAKEPGLIELDDEENEGGNRNEGDIQKNEANLGDDDDQHMRKQHSYLQPRTTPRRNPPVMKFTIVDMSLSGGKVRELRCLPSEFSCKFFDQGYSNNRDQDAEEDAEESETIDAGVLNTSVTDNGNLDTDKTKENMLGYFKKSDANESYGDAQRVASDSKKKNKLQKGKQTKKRAKPASSRKLKKGGSDHVAPVTKRCKTLTGSCKEGTTDDGMLCSQTTSGFDNEGRSDSCSSIREVTEHSSSQAALSQEILSSTTTTRTSLSDYNEKPQIQTLFDLNLPQVLPESEKAVSTKEPSKEPVVKSTKQENTSVKEPKVTAPELMSDLNTRRHSTRNRPPTAKALEALADGYLTVTKKRKGKETGSSEIAKPRTFKRARFVVGANKDQSTNSSEDSHVVEPEKVSSNKDNYNMQHI